MATARFQKNPQPFATPVGLPALRAALLGWFDVAKRDLPWRRTKDPYGIWVSEVMLQQTQVERVKGYWAAFLAAFPTVTALATAELPAVLSKWKGLGYYSRARNLHKAAQTMRAEHAGALPASHAQLLKLPGFGRYTAGAVGSIAFGLPTPIVDGNVARVLSRLFELEGAPGDKAREQTLWSLAEALVQGDRPGDLNQSLMELGALICTPSSPTCLLCPVRDRCRALAAGRVDELPVKKTPTARKALTLAVAVARRNGELLMARRDDAGLFAGLWELPSAEVATGADAREALAAALGARAKLGAHLGGLDRTLTHRDLRFEVYEVSTLGALRRLPGYQEWRWVTDGDRDALGMSSAMQAVLSLLATLPATAAR